MAMELQLAEDFLSQSGLRYSPYIWIPNIAQGGGVYVREDKFDMMSEDDFDDMMSEIAPYQIEDLGLSERETLQMLASFKSRRAERHAAKMANKAAKTDKKKSKADSRRMRAEAKKTRAQAKQDKANAGGGDDEGGSGSGKGMDIFNKVADTAQSFFNRNKGEEAGAGGGDSSAGGGDDAAAAAAAKKKKTTYWIIGGAAALLVIGGVAIAVSKKGKKAA